VILRPGFVQDEAMTHLIRMLQVSGYGLEAIRCLQEGTKVPIEVNVENWPIFLNCVRFCMSLTLSLLPCISHDDK
jgi:hypothetical protein